MLSQNFTLGSSGEGQKQLPKFPHFNFYLWSLEQVLENVVLDQWGTFLVDSIEKMLMGGIFDHLKGGIYQYAKDHDWRRPVFDKTLYDQAGLLKLLVKYCIVKPTPLAYDALIQTLDYVASE